MTAQSAERTEYRFTTKHLIVQGSVALPETGILHGNEGLSYLRGLAKRVPDRFAVTVLTKQGLTVKVTLAGSTIDLVTDIPRSSARLSPLERIKQAVTAVQSRGLKVRVGEHGVELGECSREWLARPDRIVSPLGAILLHEQPLEGEERDPEAAVANLLHVSWPFVSGLCNGMDAEPGGPYLHQACRGEYLDGCEIGFAIRNLLVTVCACGTRHPSNEVCPSCVEAVLSQREAGRA